MKDKPPESHNTMGQELTDRQVYGLLCVDHYFLGTKFPATVITGGDSLCQQHFDERASRE